jgi:hypothetical protein
MNVGPLGGHYAAIVKQGLTEAALSEEGLKELILKVDAEIGIKPILTQSNLYSLSLR